MDKITEFRVQINVPRTIIDSTKSANNSINRMLKTFGNKGGNFTIQLPPFNLPPCPQCRRKHLYQLNMNALKFNCHCKKVQFIIDPRYT